MKTRLPILAAAAAATVLGAAPMAAVADVSANVAVTSKYKYRGQDQSDAAKATLPAIQGGFDWSQGGFYLGNWNSSVGFANGTEMDFYGGYRGEMNGVGYDVGFLQYYYPGASDLNTLEIYAGASYGPFSAKYSLTASTKYFGVPAARKTGYLELKASYPLNDSVTLVGVLGNTFFTSTAKNSGVVDYSDYKLGADVSLGDGYTFGVAYVGATKKGTYGDINKSRLVLTLSKAM